MSEREGEGDRRKRERVRGGTRVRVCESVWGVTPCLTRTIQMGSFSDALGRAREDSSVQKLIKDPQVTEHSERGTRETGCWMRERAALVGEFS